MGNRVFLKKLRILRRKGRDRQRGEVFKNDVGSLDRGGGVFKKFAGRGEVLSRGLKDIRKKRRGLLKKWRWKDSGKEGWTFYQL